LFWEVTRGLGTFPQKLKLSHKLSISIIKRMADCTAVASPAVCGLTIVSMAPTRYASRSVPLQRLSSSSALAWKGATPVHIGQPRGLQDRGPCPSSVKEVERICAGLVQEQGDTRPPLVHFQSVRENQLVSEGVPMSQYSQATAIQGSDLVYKLYHAEARLVRSVLEQAGFHCTESHDWNLLWAGTVPPRYLFEGLLEFQKINHFPSSQELTRKDRLYSNVAKLQERHGKAAFDFLPETYLLPEDFTDFSARFTAEPDLVWIAKPNASSQGKGIFLVEAAEDVIVTEPYVVSRYIANPLLVNNLKFDLRVYVLVSSYDPLRIYVYNEGLARFASEEYTPIGSKRNRFMHLTNYSVNKRSEKFVQNQDYRQDNIGHKWSLSALFAQLERDGIDTDFVWMQIYDSIIKSVIAIEDQVVEATQALGLAQNNCFDLFGFDILIDSNYKPWVLEVNLSPSLATDSSLDLFVKGNLVADTLNLVGVREFDRKQEEHNRIKARIRGKRCGKAVHPVDHTGGRMKEGLRDSAEEFLRKGHFLLLYPCKGGEHYAQYFPVQRPANTQLGQCWLPASPCPPLDLRPCTSAERAHSNVQKVTVEGNWVLESKARTTIATPVKLIITGDDILLEYTYRLIVALRRAGDEEVPRTWRKSVEGFLANAVWRTTDPASQPLWRRMEVKYEEMKRRKATLKPEIRDQAKFREVISGFTSTQLEEYLKSATGGVIRDVVQPLVGRSSRGLLSALTCTLVSARNSANGQLCEEEEGEMTTFERKRSLEPLSSLSTLGLKLLGRTHKVHIRKVIRK